MFIQSDLRNGPNWRFGLRTSRSVRSRGTAAGRAPRCGSILEEPERHPAVGPRLVLQQDVQPRRWVAGRELDGEEQARLGVAHVVVDEAAALEGEAEPPQAAGYGVGQIGLQERGRLGLVREDGAKSLSCGRCTPWSIPDRSSATAAASRPRFVKRQRPRAVIHGADPNDASRRELQAPVRLPAHGPGCAERLPASSPAGRGRPLQVGRALGRVWRSHRPSAPARARRRPLQERSYAPLHRMPPRWP